MKKEPVSVYTAVRIPTELRKLAQERARQQSRSLSNYIISLIRSDLGCHEKGDPENKVVVLHAQSPKGSSAVAGKKKK